MPDTFTDPVSQASPDPVGEERPDLPARRGRAVQARPEDAGVPPARRRPLRPGNQRRRDRRPDAGLPRPAREQAATTPAAARPTLRSTPLLAGRPSRPELREVRHEYRTQ